MKKQILVACATIATISVNHALAQSGWNPTSPSGVLTTNGNTTNVGIGTATPGYKLTVDGDISFHPNVGAVRSLRGGTNNYLEIMSNTGLGGSTGDGPSLYLFSNGHSLYSNPGSIVMRGSGTVATQKAFEINNGPIGGHFLMNNNGNIGLNTAPSTTTNEVLKINGDIWLFEPNDHIREIRARSMQGGLSIHTGNSRSDGSSIIMNPKWGAIAQGTITYEAYTDNSIINANNNGAEFRAHEFNTYNETTSDIRSHMVIYSDGRVVIGDAINYANQFPDVNNGYKLITQGGILTEKVKVALSNSSEWSDFVFADNYELKPLSEVEAFIKENNHLPEIPSADEVAKEGIDLGKMDAKLLQKIEELTLYIIQQQKEIDALKRNH